MEHCIQYAVFVNRNLLVLRIFNILPRQQKGSSLALWKRERRGMAKKQQSSLEFWRASR